jgi:peptide chain release factor 1
MNPSMLAKLEQLASRHEEVSALLAEPEIIGDNDRFRALSVEYAQLEPVAERVSGLPPNAGRSGVGPRHGR